MRGLGRGMWRGKMTTASVWVDQRLKEGNDRVVSEVISGRSEGI